MSLSPETLMEETAEERHQRESYTGEIGNGLKVECRPYLDDPEIVHWKDRVVCLFRPYEACKPCPHKLFTLHFDVARKQQMQAPIACPRWEKDSDRGKMAPDHYTFVTLGTCKDVRPMSYCGSCPEPSELVQLGLDKSKPGWHGRYERYRKEAFSDG